LRGVVARHTIAAERSAAMARELEPWGGEVRLPKWLRRVLRRPDPEDTPERAREPRRSPGSDRSALENANRAAVGPMTDLYNEGRQRRRQGSTGRRGD